ncbi:hypothetical protein D9M72_310900 [compost metagenome]
MLDDGPTALCHAVPSNQVVDSEAIDPGRRSEPAPSDWDGPGLRGHRALLPGQGSGVHLRADREPPAVGESGGREGNRDH